jgi:hypothetical protein
LPAPAVETIRTVSAPFPNLVGQVFPQALQTETVESPASGSVVPAWSQRSIRSVSVSRSMWIVNVRPSDPVGAERTGRLYATRDVEVEWTHSGH